MAVVEAHDLRRVYKTHTGTIRRRVKEIEAVRGVSFAIEKGELFGLLGPNGAGKSTTVRILTTLSRPDSGSARVAGLDVLSDAARVRHAIGVVGQKHGLDPDATGRENLVLQGECYGITGADLSRRVGDALERFGLAGTADRQAKTYSGGTQRRLDLAMGLIHRPDVLFLDEPTTGLDPEVRADVWREIERLARDERMTILLTTHYLDEADRLASRLAIVDRGRIVAEGTPEELKSGLEGDRIAVELVDASDATARAALARVDGVGDAELEGNTLQARARDGAKAIPAVLAALDAHGVHVASVTLARPSLDDVYLRHAGRSFDRADAEHERAAVAA
jgi:ABC-2 type transport system ATP-binding protein